MNRSAIGEEDGGFRFSILPDVTPRNENQQREGGGGEEVQGLVKTLIDLLREDREEEVKRSDFRGREEMLEEEEEEEEQRRKRRRLRWKSFREMLKLKTVGCCGSSWSSALQESDELVATPAAEGGTQREEEQEETVGTRGPQGPGDEEEDDVENQTVPIRQTPTDGTTRETTMNLAAALAAERHLRDSQELGVEEEEGWVIGSGWCCCVCMVRGKGAAFIPCGHAFCRVCSMELWFGRRSCPLCNRQILDVLDIF